MKPLTIGMIGGGKFFEFVHAPALNLMPGIGRKVLACLDEARAKTICAQWGYDKYYLRYDDMLAAERLDAVYAITPPETTWKIAVDAIERKIPAFLEKPLVDSLESLVPIKAAYEKHRTPHFIAFNRRHQLLIRSAREFVDKEKGISHIAVDFFRHNAAAPDHLMGSVIHAIDTLRFLCGEVKSVRGVKSAARYFDNVPVSYSTLLEFESGATGALNSHSRSGIGSERYSLFAENRTLVVELTGPGDVTQPKWLKRYEGLKLTQEMDLQRDSPPTEKTAAHFNGIVAEHAYFLDRLRSGKSMSPDVEDAEKTLMLAQAIRLC